LLVHARAVGVDGHLGRTFRLARVIDGLADDEAPTLQAPVLPGRHYISFNTREQHT
jgi:hypothetical protein